MLFDLRSRHRRRVVKAVYIFLALLIGVGLVGFGVGTGGNFGGLFNAASGGGGSATGQATLEKALAAAQKRAAKHPDAATWDAVGLAAYDLAQGYYVANSGYEKQGFPVLAELQSAWNRYLATDPANPDQNLAADVAVAFGIVPTGIQKWATAESAQEIVATSTPTYEEYYALASDAYSAHEFSQGDLATARAIALAPKSERTAVTEGLALAKEQAGGTSGATSATGSTATSSTSTTGSTGDTSSASATSSTATSSTASKKG